MTVLTIATTALNECGNVKAFLDQANKAISELNLSGEIIYIDDCSSDGTGDAVEKYIAEHQQLNIKLIKHTERKGITGAIAEIAEASNGEFIALMPADMESRIVDDIPKLFRAFDADTDIVVGWRKDRGDGKVFASTVYNLLNRVLFNVKLHDANWIKIIRRDKLLGIPMHSDWHRFLIPILVHKGCKVKEVVTQWHPRDYGTSKFSLKRFPISLADMLSVKLFLEFGSRPLLLFGWISTIAGLLGSFGLIFSLFLADPFLVGISLGAIVISINSLLVGMGVDMIFLIKKPKNN